MNDSTGVAIDEDAAGDWVRGSLAQGSSLAIYNYDGKATAWVAAKFPTPSRIGSASSRTARGS